MTSTSTARKSTPVKRAERNPRERARIAEANLAAAEAEARDLRSEVRVWRTTVQLLLSPPDDKIDGVPLADWVAANIIKGTWIYADRLKLS